MMNRMELPPRTRRILLNGVQCGQPFGTTSAYAENTVVRKGFMMRSGNYLRVRGEYKDCIEFDGERLELPPRTRRIPE